MQEVSANVGAPESLCMYVRACVCEIESVYERAYNCRESSDRFLMPSCVGHFSSEETLMVLETNELEYRIKIALSILPGP